MSNLRIELYDKEGRRHDFTVSPTDRLRIDYHGDEEWAVQSIGQPYSPAQAASRPLPQESQQEPFQMPLEGPTNWGYR